MISNVTRSELIISLQGFIYLNESVQELVLIMKHAFFLNSTYLIPFEISLISDEIYNEVAYTLKYL